MGTPADAGPGDDAGALYFCSNAFWPSCKFANSSMRFGIDPVDMSTCNQRIPPNLSFTILRNRLFIVRMALSRVKRRRPTKSSNDFF